MTPFRALLTCLMSFAVGGCMGDSLVTGKRMEGPPKPPEDVTPRCTPGAHAVPKLLRLSNREYQQVVSDLLGDAVNPQLFRRWTPIAQVYGFDTMSESRMDGQALEEQLATVQVLTEQLLTSPQVRGMCPAQATPPPACALRTAYDATKDFSAEQGVSCWQYRDSNAPLVYSAAQSRWENNQQPYLSISATVMHPGPDLDAVRRWMAPTDGTLAAAGGFRDLDPVSGDGVVASIQRNGKDLWSRTIANGSADTFSLNLTVRRGDVIDIVLNRNGAYDRDQTAVDVALTFKQAPLTVGWTWENCGRAVVTRLASRAFRRPLRPEELADYQAMFASSLQGAAKADLPSPFHEALTTVMQAALLSPNVMFKPELVPGGLDASEKAFGTASRLSLYFRGSFADEELWELAESGALSDRAVVKAQAERLLARYADRFTADFGGQWLDFRDGEVALPLAGAMKAEAAAVFNEVLSAGLPPQRLLNPGFTFVNAPLAAHYQLATTATATSFEKVSTSERGGLLSQGFFLAQTAQGSDFARVIHRGLWTMNRVLCQSLPRLDQATLEEISNSVGAIDRKLPLAQQMALHRDSSSRCSSCHAKTDPIGLALEAYDAKGLWREGVAPNDFQLNGQPVRNPAELTAVIEHSADFQQCVATKLLTYALNRGPVEEEACTASALAAPPGGVQPSLQELAVSALLAALPLTEVAP